jgi:peptide/nickel transport system permease protein
MAAFLVRRLLSGLVVVAVLIFLVFFVFNEIPATPACLVVACGPKTTTTDAQIRAANHDLGIDRPVHVQFADFVWSLVRDGDFGTSWVEKERVGTMLTRALPVTLSLVAGGMILMLLLAIPLGTFAGTRARSPVDRGVLAVSVAGIAVHPFVLGITIGDVFEHVHVTAAYCPLTGKTPGMSCGGPLAWAGHLAVPWLVFALLFLPFYMRMVRVRLLETLGEPWVSTARAKGASEARVLAHHVPRNAFGPLVPMLAVDAGTAITAAIYVETVFGLHGFGSLAVGALSGTGGGYDLPVIAGIVTVVGTAVVVVNIAADAAAAWLDPRIRKRTEAGLVPLPRAIATRPRARGALNVAVAALLLALVGLAVIHPGSDSPSGVELGAPIRTLQPRWVDYKRLGASIALPGQPMTTALGGTLELDVTKVEIGPTGWRVRAAVVNNSPISLRVLGIAPPGTPAAYPNVPFSLVVQTDNGSGIKTLQPLAASEFEPPLPKVLAGHASWRGTFAGSATVKKGTLFYVGFGEFFYVNAPNDPLPISVTTTESATA